MSSLAQEEADRYLNPKTHITHHPEDQSGSDREEDDNHSLQEPEKSEQYHHSDDGDDDELDDTADVITRRMISAQKKSVNYHIPTSTFDANTGPKGVIADAQSYERAKRQANKETVRPQYGAYEQDGSLTEKSALSKHTESDDDADDDDEEAFMERWRQARMEELRRQQTSQPTSGRKTWGKLETVGAKGYLDAVEQTPRSTVVVVCIYDPQSAESSVVEEGLATLAQEQDTTRFIKLHHEIAEMDHVTAPAILAYRGGDLFATIVDILKLIPADQKCNASSLGDLLMEHRVL